MTTENNAAALTGYQAPSGRTARAPRARPTTATSPAVPAASALATRCLSGSRTGHGLYDHFVVFIVPGPLETRTGGYEYDRRMIRGLGACGWSVEVRELDGTFPHPTPAALEGAARVLADIPDCTTVLIDGLALGAMPAQG